jgi:hypothetical protein
MIKHRTFDPHKSILEPTIFKVTVLLIITLSLTTAIIIIYSTRLHFDLSSNGLNNAVSIFRIPLSILTLVIPLVALISANHRSEQTREQLRLSNNQNNFTNYYKHIDEFEKHCQKQWNKYEFEISKPRSFHKMLFPKAMDGQFTISSDFIISIDEFLSHILDISRALNSADEKEYILACIHIKNSLNDFCKKNKISQINNSEGLIVECNGEIAIMQNDSTKTLLKNLKSFCIVINELLSFDLESKEIHLISKFINLNLNEIPDSTITHNKKHNPLDLKMLLDVA